MLDKPRTISPMKATNAQICQMRRDHTEFGDFSLMTDGFKVWISEQEVGHDRTQHIEMPKATFNQLLRWYLRESKLRWE